MKILIIGGAGYIGSYMVKFLIQQNHEPLILDNLSTSKKKLLLNVPFYYGCLGDVNLVSRIFSEHKIDAVMHFAALSQVGESTRKPNLYYTNNVVKTIYLLDQMIKHGVNNIIFSSTAAIFGNPIYVPIDEEHSKQPINPYGTTKKMIEDILEDYNRAYGINYCCLRYFNAAGADPEGLLGECHHPETHLIPLCLDVALGKREYLNIYGNDYPTKDGTCVRDYIHIHDLANAHLLALNYISKFNISASFNLGNGSGYSVKEIVDVVEKITAKKIKIYYTKRRLGDPAILIANAEKIKKNLNWTIKFSNIETIIEHAWNWAKKTTAQQPRVLSGREDFYVAAQT